MSQNPEEKVIFGVAPDEGDGLAVILQVPPEAWAYMKDGKTHSFDLTKIGIPLRIILAGCKNRADAVAIIEAANKAKGYGTLRDTRDFGIPEASK